MNVNETLQVYLNICGQFTSIFNVKNKTKFAIQIWRKLFPKESYPSYKSGRYLMEENCIDKLIRF